MRGLNRATKLLGGAGLAGCLLAGVLAPGTALASPPICGTLHGPPGTLAGTYSSNVIIEGTCNVNAGPATVRGSITIRPGGQLLAAFALDHRSTTPRSTSRLLVNGNITAQAGSTLILGCDPQSYPCEDDPANKNPEEAPTLSSRSQVFGNINSREAFSVIVHNDRINGNVSQNGGGGGITCFPEAAPPFSNYSAYEDTTVRGNVNVSNMASCWLGINRLRVNGNVTVNNNQMADPDAIEILANRINGNLGCRENSMTWNSVEEHMSSTFPRIPMPNTVIGNRSGQCKLASPLTEGGETGPGPF